MPSNLGVVSPELFVAIIVAALGALVLAMTACGGGESAQSTSQSQPATEARPAKGSADLSGTIEIDGSSTTYPITEAMAEEFGDLTDGNVKVVVGISGTGGGFKKFCAGETVISNASRPIKQKEIDLCAEAGIEYVEVPVGIDGLSVMVNPGNDFVECVTIDELHTLWRPEAEETVTKWSEVRAGWPDREVRLYGPGTDSGTFDYFTETVNGDSGASRGDFLASEDDNVLVTGIGGDPNSLGYFGYAYYSENQDRLKIVGIDGGNGCITPSDETINNGAYSPLSRPLFIYVRADVLEEPHIRGFLEFYLSEGSRELISETGYIPFEDTVYGLAMAKVQGAITGAAFGGDARLSGTVEEVLRASQ
jgi:phosphate transport system substrate-binding protein